MRSQGCGTDDSSFRRRPKRRAGSSTRLRMTARSPTSASGSRKWRWSMQSLRVMVPLWPFRRCRCGINCCTFHSRSRHQGERKGCCKFRLSGARSRRQKKTHRCGIERCACKCGTGGSGCRVCARTSDDGKHAHAEEHGRLVQLRKQRDAENLAAAEARLREAFASYDALPVPTQLPATMKIIR
jgi:hypothetical protein